MPTKTSVSTKPGGHPSSKPRLLSGGNPQMAARDGSDQRLYFAECRPQERAGVLVDYADIDAPMIVRG